MRTRVLFNLVLALTAVIVLGCEKKKIAAAEKPEVKEKKKMSIMPAESSRISSGKKERVKCWMKRSKEYSRRLARKRKR